MRFLTDRRFINVLLIIALVLLSGSILLAFRDVQQLEKANAWVRHTQETINESNKVVLSLSQAELLVKDYLEQGNNKVPLLLKLKHADVVTDLNKLDQLTKEHLAQQQLVGRLRDLANEKIALLQRALQDPQLSLPTTSRATLNTNLRDLDGRIGEVVGNIQESELVLEGIWGSKYRLDARLTNLTLLFTGLLGNILLLLSFILLNYQVIRRRNAERAKEKIASNFERIINSSHDLIASIDTQYLFTAFNAAYLNKFEQLFGKTILPGMSLEEAFSETGDIEVLLTAWKRALNGEAFTVIHQFEITEEEETQTKFYEATYSPIYDFKGLLIGACHIMRDVTERRKVDEIKNEFISIVSHELQSPLNSIQSSLGMILGGGLGQLDGKTRNMLNIAHQNCEKLISLINNILDVKKIETGESPFHLEPIDVNDLINDSIMKQIPYSEQKQIDLHFVSSEESPILVMGDRQRLLQVLESLLVNSIKFTHPNSEIRILAERKKELVRVSILNKSGIPEEFQAHLFDKEIDHEHQELGKRAGVGLGLNISKAIIERHQGNLYFSSKPNEESVFYFELPILNESPSIPENPQILQASTFFNNESALPTILHIEDDPDLSTVISSVLHERANVIAVQSKHQALRQLSEYKFDLVLLDLMLPDSTGFDLLPEIKKLNIPIVVFSAYELPKEYQSYVDFYLQKSKTTNQQLIETVESILKRKIKTS